eukprot:403334267
MTIQAIFIEEITNTLYLGGKHMSELVMGSYDLLNSHRLIWFNEYKGLEGYEVYQLNTYLIDSFADTDIVKFSPYLGSVEQRFYDILKDKKGIIHQQSSLLYDDNRNQIFISGLSKQNQDFIIAQLNLNPISMSRNQYSIVNPLGINDYVVNQILELTDEEILGCFMYSQEQSNKVFKNYVGYVRFNKKTNSITKVSREQNGQESATTYRRCASINKNINGEIRLFVTSQDRQTFQYSFGYYRVQEGIPQHKFFQYSTFEKIDIQIIKAKFFKLKDGWFFTGQFILNNVQTGFIETSIAQYSCFSLFTSDSSQSQQPFQDLISYSAISTSSITQDNQNQDLIKPISAFKGSPYYHHMSEAVREAYPEIQDCQKYAGDIQIFHIPSQKVLNKEVIECVLYDTSVCEIIASYSISECYDAVPMYFELKDYAQDGVFYSIKQLTGPYFSLDISSYDFEYYVEVGPTYHVQVLAYMVLNEIVYRQNDKVDFYVTFTACTEQGFQLYSDDKSLEGKKIRIKVSCFPITLNNIIRSELTATQSFTIEFLKYNTAPYFNEQYQELTIVCETTQTVTLPEVKDDENDSYFISVEIDPAATVFVKYDEQSKIITMTPTLPEHEGFFWIYANAVQTNYQSLYSYYQIALTVVPYSTDAILDLRKKEASKTALPKLKARIKKISNSAVVTVQFAEQMITPKNKAQLEILNNTLAVYFLSDQMGKIQLSFNLLSFKEDTLLLKLSFPFDKSTISLYSVDEIEIVFLSGDAYLNIDFDRKIPQNYAIKKEIIPQLSNEELDFLSTMSEIISLTLSSILGPSLIINLAMSQGLQALWGMIKGLQLLTHLPLMNLIMPANLLCFYSLMNDIANFNLISTDSFANDFIKIDEESDYAINYSFAFMGYNSVNLITNLGMLFYLIIINILIMNKILFNQILRFLIETQLELFLCSILAVTNIKYNIIGEQLSTIIAYILTLILIAKPFLATFIVYKMKNDQAKNQSLSSIYEDYNLDNPLILVFTFVLAIPLYHSPLHIWLKAKLDL